jgi:hypothetical protein
VERVSFVITSLYITSCNIIVYSKSVLILDPQLFHPHQGHLGGVVISVLATGPRVMGSNPAEAMDF